MEIKINRSLIRLEQGDITTQKVDAIVNAANQRLAGGGGVDGAIHRAGGPEIMAACRKYDGCPTGTAVITTGGRLPAKYVIHTVGPVYKNGKAGEPELLRSAYLSSLTLADENNITALAFPSISTGVYGYPIEAASRIALQTVADYIKGETRIGKVIFVLFSAGDLAVYRAVLDGLCSSFPETGDNE